MITVAAVFACVFGAFAAQASADDGARGYHGTTPGYGYHSDAYTRSTFAAIMTGANEVPPVHARTSGVSGVAFDEAGKRMVHTLYVFKGDEIISAHLHCGNPGENGPIVVSLFNDPNGTDVDGHLASSVIGSNSIASTARGCNSVIGYDINSVADLAEAIRAGDIYTNVHSQAYPDGVARGQLVHILDSGDSRY